MNVLMLTNVFAPHVGGITRSIESFTRELEKRGHRVLIVAPSYETTPPDDSNVVRIPAIPRVLDNRHSLPIALPGYLSAQIEGFRPNIVHAHHPFLLGTAAATQAALYQVPLIYTHHTHFEAHIEASTYHSDVLVRFVHSLTKGFANLASAVIAPSRGIARDLRAQGVESPIEIIPTGVDVGRFESGNGARFRDEVGIPENAFVVGHVGRFSPEKNLLFLARAVSDFLRRRPDDYFLGVGAGSILHDVEKEFQDRRCADRAILTGAKEGQPLVDAYHAMNVFAFSSKSETQGMVLSEAMACGLPVVALEATGVEDLVRDRVNGRMLHDADTEAFARTLEWYANRTPEERESFIQQAKASAHEVSMNRTAESLIQLYERSIREYRRETASRSNTLLKTVTSLAEREISLFSNLLQAIGDSLFDWPS